MLDGVVKLKRSDKDVEEEDDEEEEGDGLGGEEEGGGQLVREAGVKEVMHKTKGVSRVSTTSQSCPNHLPLRPHIRPIWMDQPSSNHRPLTHHATSG